MTYTVIILPEAEKDLIDIYSHIAFNLLSPLTALNQINKIKSDIQKLNEMPKRFQLYPNEPWHTRGMRYMLSGNYVIFYIPDDSKQKVMVHHVIYAGRNITDIFDDIQ